MCKSECSLKIGGSGGAVTDPGRCDFGVAFDGRGHGPAHCLHKLGCQVAGDGDWGIYNSAYIVDKEGETILAQPNDFQQLIKKKRILSDLYSFKQILNLILSTL